MPKSDDADMKQLGSDATQAIGPLKKQVETAFKAATMMVKSPNPKVAESLADAVEELMSEISGLKSLLKDLKAASK